MYGFFLNSNKFISPDNYKDIQSGTPIVLTNKNWIYPNFVQFAIYVNIERVIFQSYIKLEDGNDAYEIQETTFCNFIRNGDNTLYEYIPEYNYDANSVVRNAISCITNKTTIGFSIFGDDFVFACMVGTDNMIKILNNTDFGKHYLINRRKIAKYQHHAITLEGGKVIHFAIVDNQNKNIPYITLQSFNQLDEPRFVQYPNETLYDRLVARNRALLAWIGVVDFGKYNLASNNCEHFARWCKTGKHNSMQVKQALYSLTMLTMSLITGQSNYIGHTICEIRKKHF